jgi:3-oxoacyl-[acyl-carrier protein] reductase
VQAIRDQGGDAVAHETDLGDPDNIPKLFDLCEEELGSVDIVVNNHSHCVNETFDPALTLNEGSDTYLTSAAGISTHFAINAQSYALIMSEYLNRYLKRKAGWGRIINISTDAAHAHTANISYAASKHAIESYSRSAAAEMGKYGITVNIVAPGPTQTGYITPESEKYIVANMPLQRLGEPEDIADVVVFFATEQARWVTGQLIYVGGGWRMHQ